MGFLFSDSNEIAELIESLTRWKVTHLDYKDKLPEETDDVLVFDILFYRLPDHEWTVQELLEKRPQWVYHILPLLKAKHYVYLFTNGDWCLMTYIKELDKVYFRNVLRPPVALFERQCLMGGEFLTFTMKQEIRDLIDPARCARDLGERLTDTLKRPVDLGVPITFRGLCDTMEEKMNELNREIDVWKDRFFFDALETSEDDLCYECKEEMRQAFYVREDQSQALKWKPHGDWCSEKDCKYYKTYLFNDWYKDTDVRETPVEYVGYSDYSD